MKLQINLSEDKELRDYIKSLILEQVVSITRQEILDAIKNIVNLDDPSKQEKLWKLSEIETKKQVREFLSYNSIRAIANAEIGKMSLNEIKEVADKKTKEMFEDSIAELVDKKVKQVLKSLLV